MFVLSARPKRCTMVIAPPVGHLVPRPTPEEPEDRAHGALRHGAAEP